MYLLVVEDNPEDASMLTETLSTFRESGLEIVRCRTVSEAIQHATARAPAMTILDLALPDSTDWLTLKRYRAALPTGPVLVISQTADERSTFYLIQIGATFCLPKLSPSVLAEMEPVALYKRMIVLSAINTMANWQATQDLLTSMSAVPERLRVLEERLARQDALMQPVLQVVQQFPEVKAMCEANTAGLQQLRNQVEVADQKLDLIVAYTETLAQAHQRSAKLRANIVLKIIGYLAALLAPVISAWAAWTWRAKP